MILLIPIQKLPDRPGELIRAALSDIEECERDQRYSIESLDDFWERQWHRLSRDRTTCNVCAAGAVMAKSLYVSWGETCTPDDFEQDTRKKLMALNEFRQGDIHTALVHILGYDNNPLAVDRRITPYAQNRRLFFRQMNILADDLEAHGL